MTGTVIWTIGHSTHSIDNFIALLTSHQISTLVDVRRFPGSKRLPQFNKLALSESLTAAGIKYIHLPDLGGRGSLSADLRKTRLGKAGFRGYADYMESEAFTQGIDRLLELAGESRTAIMCAEALWWRCHRSLISDHLLSKQMDVVHILSTGKTEAHHYTSAAMIIDGELTYPGLV